MTIGYPPEALRELDRLERMQHYHLRRNTIIALVDARLAGQSEETVWQRENTCSRNTWHSKWKRNTLMQDVLATVERSVREWQDGEELRALVAARRMLALASPRAAEAVVTQLECEDLMVQQRAAFGILDRADPMTAAKAQEEHRVEFVWNDGNNADRSEEAA